MKKLSIGFVFDDSLDSSDGVAQQVKLFGEWLSERGHKVSYLVGQTGLKQWHGGRVYSLSKNMPVSFNGNKLTMPTPASRHQIKRVLQNEKFDILHVQVPYSPFMAGRVIKLASPSTKIVGTFHIFPASWLAKVGGRLLRLITSGSSRRFSKILSVSPVAADFAAQTFGYKSAVLPNAIDLAKFKNSQLPTKGRIVFLGRLVERKNAAMLIEAFSLIAPHHPESQLIIGGKGPMRADLKAQAERLRIADKVVFTGFVAEADKPSLLASADIACFPSLGGESFGVVLLEAMAAGSGVVLAGNNPGYTSVLGSLEECLFDPKSAKDLAQLLSKLLGGSNISSALHKAQQKLVQRYDINLVGSQLEQTYYQLIAD